MSFIFVLVLVMSAFNMPLAALGLVNSAQAAGLNVNLDQWANGTATSAASWQNGNLNGNNSTYGEGIVVPFRYAIEGLDAGHHSFHINYDWTAGGHKAYDFLASYNASEFVTHVTGHECDAGGGAVSSMCPTLSAPLNTPFPGDPFVSNGKSVDGAIAFSGLAAQRFLTSYGVTNVTISAVTHAGDTSGNSTADLVVSFDSAGGAAFFLWGGHLAQSIYWDATPNGAGQISGAPWHMRTQQLDDSGNKNQDRSIQPSALVPTLSITKTADAATVAAGGQIGFLITVTNSGPGGATNVVVTDTLPTGTGISWSVDAAGSDSGCSISSNTLTCNFGNMSQNTSKHVHVISPTTNASCGTYNNTASVSASSSFSATSQQATITVTTCASPDVTVAKTGNGPINAGATATFTITVTAGGTGSSNNVALSDTLPSGTWTLGGANAAQCNGGVSTVSGTLTCSFGTMGSGTSKVITLSRATTGADCPSITNPLVTVSATGDTNTNNNTAGPTTITVNCQPDVSIAKTGNGPITAGGTATFTITVTAGGTGSSTNVTVNDTLPAGTWTLGGANAAQCNGGAATATGTLTCNFGTMASGTSKSVTLSRATTAGDCPSISNTATVTATGDTNTGNNSSSATITVNCQPDVSVVKSGNGPIAAGGTATFSITVTAGGTGPSSNVTLSDTLPSGTWTLGGADAAACSITSGTLTCNFGTMASGTSKTVTLSRTTSGADCPSIPNTATISATGDTNAGNNSSSATITVNCAPDVSIIKQGSPAVSAGGVVTFSIVVTAGGTGPSTNVTLTDALPAGTWTLGGADAAQCNIASGTLTCTFGTMAEGTVKSVTLTRTTTAQDCPSITNTATVTATGDATTQNNTASATITVNCGAIGITKLADAASVDAGSNIGFTITVTNSGAGSATNVTVTDSLPAGLSWSISPANAGCAIAAGTLTCNFGTLAPAGTASVHLLSPTTAASCGTIRNLASVTTSNDGSAESADSVTVTCHPDVSVLKTGNGPLTSGATATFTIVVSAAGTGGSTNVTLSDTLPAGTWTLGGANAASCTLAGSSLSCNFGSMTSGTSKTITLSRPSTNSDCTTPIANTATVNATGDSNLQNNSSSASITVNCPPPPPPPPTPQSPNVTVAKTADATVVTAGTQGGSTVGFTITVTNSGPITTAVSLSDTPLLAAGPNTPSGNAGTALLTWTIDTANSDPGCNITGITLSCGFGSLTPGASKHVHITATVTARSSATSRNDNCGQRVENVALVTIGDGSNRSSNRATIDIACLPTTSAGTLTITKYSDNNGNAARDSNESALAGWTFQVTNNATGATKLVTTDASGSATVTDLEFGTYTVTETSCASPCDKSKWTAISYKIGADAAVKSASGAAQVTISGPAQSVTFGNRPPQLPSTSTEDNTSARLQAMVLLLVAAMLLELLALRMRATVSLSRRQSQ